MMDLRHAALKFATLPLAGEVDRRTDPDALGNTKGLLQNSLEQRLDLSDSLAEPWNRIRRKTIRNEQRGRRRGHHRPRQLLACHQGVADDQLAAERVAHIGHIPATELLDYEVIHD